MPKTKLKSKRTLTRRYKVSKTGKIKVFKCGHKHFMRKRSKRILGEATKAKFLSGASHKIFKKLIPWAV